VGRETFSPALRPRLIDSIALLLDSRSAFIVEALVAVVADVLAMGSTVTEDGAVVGIGMAEARGAASPLFKDARTL